MKLMIRAHDLGVKGEEAIIKAVAERGLDGVQLVAYKSVEDIKYEQGAISEKRASEIGKTIADGGKEIALIGAYFNPVHPNEEKIERGIAVFKDYLDCASAFGCNTVGSETGSYNGDPWIYHPMNHSDEALDRVVRTFGELAEYAAERKVNIGMEGAFGHVCHTPERLDEAVRRIGGDNVRIIFDLYNYLDISNYTSAYDILERGLNIFGDRILLFHVKDFTVEDGRLCQCGVGKGILDYEKILGKIFDCSPNETLVLEGTVGEDIDYAISHLKKIINKMTYYSKES